MDTTENITVLAASPNSDHYKEWMKGQGRCTTYIGPWTLAELHAGAEVLRQVAGRVGLTQEVVRGRWVVFGGTIRSVLDVDQFAVADRLASLQSASQSEKINDKSVKSLLDRVGKLDARERNAPPSELAFMWPRDNVHQVPHLWPASPFAAQLIGARAIADGISSEVWQQGVYEQAVVQWLAHGTSLEMHVMTGAKDPAKTLQLVRRRVLRSGDSHASAVEELMRLPWAPELSASEGAGPALEEMLCLKHLPKELEQAPWAAELARSMVGSAEHGKDEPGEGGGRVVAR